MCIRDRYISFAEGVEQGLIRFVGDDCKKALYDAIEARQVRPGLCKNCLLYTSAPDRRLPRQPDEGRKPRP